MKHITILFALLLSFNCHAQQADDIIGKWIKTNKEDLIIQVYKEKDTYNGKISWSKDNTKPAGYIILSALRYNSKTKKWGNGEIHDPKSGRQYAATAKMKPDGTLEVNGHIGVSFFGSKRIFRRVN